MPTPRPARGLRAAVLAVTTAVPLLLGATVPVAPATAPPAPMPATGPAPAARPVPEDALVPGQPPAPTRPYQRGTPDQGAYPPDGAPAERDARRDGARTPGAAYAAPRALVEYVPPGEQARPGATREPRKARCSRSTGPYQRKVERYLKLRPDGRQSPSDCRAIRAYQAAVGIHPANGFAGPVTWRVMTLRWARKHPDRLHGCPRSRARVVCVDLNRQLLWVARNGRVVFAPVPTRTGRPGYPTRTGRHHVTHRVRHERSRIYGSPMPFSQYFDGGQAIHGVYDDLYATSGSHGCVNLEYQDAARLWKLLRTGDRVHVWGRKPHP
ncbi:L,D-transpeptidase family protein [Streptomyces phytohabitans]|uniref:L,D-transpeptidase family protein n=1 Tax=Streptomyces phytohabitans TaxID=1150371 RepID=UPI00345B6FFD